MDSTPGHSRTRVEVTKNDKHSSLFKYKIMDIKSFIVQTPVFNPTKTLFGLIYCNIAKVLKILSGKLFLKLSMLFLSCDVCNILCISDDISLKLSELNKRLILA